jgi:hypothetical protein
MIENNMEQLQSDFLCAILAGTKVLFAIIVV